MSILHSTGLNVWFSGLINTFNHKGQCINNSNENKRFQYALTFNKKMGAANKKLFQHIETPKSDFLKCHFSQASSKEIHKGPGEHFQILWGQGQLCMWFASSALSKWNRVNLYVIRKREQIPIVPIYYAELQKSGGTFPYQVGESL